MNGELFMMAPGDNIFLSGAEVLVNPVDAVTGAQGKGLAKLFMTRFPAAGMNYKRIAKRGIVEAGNVWVYDIGPHASAPRWIFFAATKYHWRHDSTLGDVQRAARHVGQEAISVGARSIAIPALGCGLGGLGWEVVRPLLEAEGKAMAGAGIVVKLYPPHDGEKRGAS